MRAYECNEAVAILASKSPNTWEEPGLMRMLMTYSKHRVKLQITFLINIAHQGVAHMSAVTLRNL